MVSSAPGPCHPDSDFAWFPLRNPGVASIPAGFLIGWLGTVLGDRRQPQDDTAYKEFEVRMPVGAKE
ncbi:hypothetical protein [Streptomyces sp. bgisy027]|uniref:hypothetical protein n=1 Tax=unclassified Streptomyces TaxID=2593676 RepID=UPI003D73D97F